MDIVIRKRWDTETFILTVITTALLAFIVAPILFVVIVSFTDANTLEFPPPRWGVRWYRAATELMVGEGWRAERLTESLLTSLEIAVLVMTIATTAGTLASYALARYRFRGKMLVEQLVTLPLVFPLVVLGISLLVLISYLGIDVGIWGIVTAHVIIAFPFVVRNCTSALSGVSKSLEEAAHTLGATWLRTFWEIVLPLMRPGILAGMLIAFMLSFNEFTVTYFLYTVDVFPFSIWLFCKSNNSLVPTIFALSSAVILLNIGLLILLDRIMGSGEVSM